MALSVFCRITSFLSSAVCPYLTRFRYGLLVIIDIFEDRKTGGRELNILLARARFENVSKHCNGDPAWLPTVNVS